MCIACITGGGKNFVANKFRAVKFGGFSKKKIAWKNLMGFFQGQLGNILRNKGNGAEGIEDFWQDKFRAVKIWWVFFFFKKKKKKKKKKFRKPQ